MCVAVHSCQRLTAIRSLLHSNSLISRPVSPSPHLSLPGRVPDAGGLDGVTRQDLDGGPHLGGLLVVEVAAMHGERRRGGEGRLSDQL